MFFTETKKLFQPFMLLIGLLIGLVFYQQNLSFIYEYWPNGSAIPVYDYAKEWQERFGPSLEDDELQIIEEEYQQLLALADERIADDETAKQLRLANYAAFSSWSEQHLGHKRIDEMTHEEQERVEQIETINQALVDEEGQSIVTDLRVLKQLLERRHHFDSETNFFEREEYTATEQKVLSEELFHKNGWRSLLPEDLAFTLSHHFADVFILLIFLLSLWIPAVFVRDRLLRMRSLQWGSQHGRNILWSQFGATMAFGFLVISLVTALFYGMLYLTDFPIYFANGLNSFLSGDTLSFSLQSWSFGQWLAMVVLLIYLFGLSFCSLLFFMAQTSQHYLSLLMKVIPVVFIFIFIADVVIKNAFYLKNSLYQWSALPLIELYTGIFLLILSVGISIGLCSYRQKQDLLD
ncbi:hypothetical protein [Enterococcus olivae]